MKRIESIDEVILTASGEPMTTTVEDKSPFTCQKALLNLIGTARAKDGEEALTILNMGIALRGAKKNFLINEKEKEDVILQRIIDQNNMGQTPMGGLTQYPAHIIGLLHKKLKEAVLVKTDGSNKPA